MTDGQLAADRTTAVMAADQISRLLETQRGRFTSAERQALRLARTSLERFLDRTIEEG